MAAAADPADRLPDPAQEARARALFANIRCLVCQNESIDDSQAELAADLRKLVREKVQEGRSDAEIKTFLVDRYGEFVLMTPSLSAGNLALWGGPFLVVLLGGGLLFARLRNRSPEEPLTPEEAERLKGLSETAPD
jgi:cytochrome c-type biogenesis protein CcmH